MFPQTPTAADQKALTDDILRKLRHQFGRSLSQATPLQQYQAVAMTVRDRLMASWNASAEQAREQKQKTVYYLSLEFLMGKFLQSNLQAAGLTGLYRETLAGMGLSLEELAAMEADPGLGNGGLGRLAACFLDSLACQKLPAMGCGIRYDYGLFRQKIVEGEQVEMPDHWLSDGCVWEIAQPEEFSVWFGGRVVEYSDETGRLCHRLEEGTRVRAVPYDIPIPGLENGFANTLRIWRARSPEYIDLAYFSQGDYLRAGAEQELAQTISRILYPNDSHNAGKSLRLRQQYFFTSATLQYIVKRHKEMGLPMAALADTAAIQINDTHPAIAIAEMMRILLDEERFSWEDAFDLCQRLFSYTNHTIMSEALETWPCYLLQNLLPRVYMLILELDRRFRARLSSVFTKQEAEDMAIVSYDRVHMARLCLAVCHKANGVSGLHTELLKKDLFAGFHRLNPGQMISITNGVSVRRWLLQANPRLSELISQALAGREWISDLSLLSGLAPFAKDSAFRGEFAAIKRENKQKLAEYVFKASGICLDPDSIFDVQIKRLHEYKRQLLNALHILYLYFDIVENGADHPPKTFIFGAKASPGYTRAKQVIALICAIAKLVGGDPRVKGRLSVVFLENYGVSAAEKIIPAADISQQISLAGKEASGTGNMKLMMNGALTIGTLDGANVEMTELLGRDNIFLFGLTEEEVRRHFRYGGTPPMALYRQNARLARAIDALADGTLSENTASLKDYLLNGDGGPADPYLCLTDFASYAAASEKMERLYQNQEAWREKAVWNTARSGFFTSDRSIAQYNEEIWRLAPTE